eukprot:CAMPEP_0184694560 /NCGR_PEP_ID=MMETSP0313-20130426/2460_1 /TAXON_ID=2792 /ORGANISM="Porphyridium aerugineum, Strain SAG 1380-2" /LENGTH=1037 /DNA_ID=CAMNT_0027152857 /DNA_START=117 /DNA_END=3230 /DNA_ORIENTATION=-
MDITSPQQDPNPEGLEQELPEPTTTTTATTTTTTAMNGVHDTNNNTQAEPHLTNGNMATDDDKDLASPRPIHDDEELGKGTNVSTHQSDDPEVPWKQLYKSQVAAVFIKNWHFHRRQKAALFCNFVIPPLFLILLAVLSMVLSTRSKAEYDYEEEPLGGFPPTPFKATMCADTYFQNNSNMCGAYPIVPQPWEIPVSLPPNSGSSLEQLGRVLNVICQPNLETMQMNCTEEIDASIHDGMLGFYSLIPFIFPDAIPPNSFAETQTPYDGVYRYNWFNNRTTDNPYYSGLMAAQTVVPPLIDNLYGTRTAYYNSTQSLMDELYNSAIQDGAFDKYYGAMAFNSFSFDSASAALNLDAVLFYNNTPGSEVDCAEGNCQLPSLVMRLLSAVTSYVAPNVTSSVYLRLTPVVTEAGINFLPLIISILIGILWHFLMPSFLAFLVLEKTARFRIMMKMMGLEDKVYWVVNYISLYIIYLIFNILCCAIGAAIQIPFFVDNTPLSWLVLFFLWGNSLIAFCMFLAPWFQDPQTALVFGWFYVILINLIGGQYIGTLYTSDAPASLMNAVSILPSFAFLRAVYYAGAFNAGGKGVTVSSEMFSGVDLGMCSGSGPFCICYGFLAGMWVFLIVCGLYFDKVLPTKVGIREHPLFFLGYQNDGTYIRPKWLGGKGKDGVKAPELSELAENDHSDDPTGSEQSDESQDVAVERANARKRGAELGVCLYNLKKTYPNGKKAVQSLSLALEKGEVFGLLGHNGSGKTTTLSVLTGLMPMTSGYAYLNGYSVINDMQRIYRHMGVCPQFDILYKDLTGSEHLYFYARLHGVPKTKLAERVEKSLDSVGLAYAKDRLVGQYSGGMKRRLSVAISLVNDPPIVMLDEISTGLDPKSRYSLWETIQKCKENKTIILTTHSMEESERLCSRVGIMAYGRLLCVGTPEELRFRLGKGYHLSVMLDAKHEEEFTQGLKQNVSQEASVVASLAGSLIFELPRSIVLSSVFEYISSVSASFGIRDWGISQSTLEDIFIQLTRDAERKEEQANAVNAEP